MLNLNEIRTRPRARFLAAFIFITDYPLRTRYTARLFLLTGERKREREKRKKERKDERRCICGEEGEEVVGEEERKKRREIEREIKIGIAKDIKHGELCGLYNLKDNIPRLRKIIIYVIFERLETSRYFLDSDCRRILMLYFSS